MLVYYAVTLFSIFIMWCVQRYQNPLTTSSGIDLIYTKRYKNISTCIIPFIPLFLLSALRYGIGTDYFHTYYPTFQRILHGVQTNTDFEYGFYYLNKFVALFSNDVTWVLAACALLFFVFVGLSIIQQSDNPAFSIALLFGTGLYTYSLNGVRQAIVIAIWFYALRFVKEKCFLKFLICMLASSLFHASAILLIPFYFLFQKKFTPLEAIVIVVVTLLAVTALKRVILFLAGFTRYLDKFAGSALLEGDFAYSEFIMALILFIYLILLYRVLKDSWKYNFLLLATVLSLICAILTKDIYIIARISVFFRFIPVIYIPSTLKAFRGNTNKRIVRIAFVFLYFVYMWFMTGYLGKGDSVPYQSIFNR